MKAALQITSLLLGCAVVPAQAQPEAPEPRAEQAVPGAAGRVESAEERAEETSPATYGVAVMTGFDGRLTVQRVFEGSASALAGLQPGDVIVSVDGTLITEGTEFQQYLAAHPTSPVEIAVERDGMTHRIVLSDDAAIPQTSRRPDFDADARPALGVRFFAGDQVIVAETLPDSPAEQAGLQAGDHLVAVNDQVIASSDHFITLIAAADGPDPLSVKYVRGTERHVTDVDPEAWDVVFGSPQQQLDFRTDNSTNVSAAPVVGTVPVYWTANMSPVGVPLTAFPYYAPYPAYAYWSYGYYPYAYPVAYYAPYFTYSPYWYYGWPYGVRWGGPYPGRPNRPLQPDSATRMQDHQFQNSRSVSIHVPGH